jgi:hypothetical protein
MTLFQFLFGGLMLGLVLVELTLQLSGRTRRTVSCLRSSVWLLALFLILVPDATNRVAGWLSIGRGADALLYCTAVGFPIGFFYLLHAVERQREQITLLVRSIALQRPYFQPNQPASHTTSAAPLGQSHNDGPRA